MAYGMVPGLEGVSESVGRKIAIKIILIKNVGMAYIVSV
jgi:hypothetical protein